MFCGQLSQLHGNVEGVLYITISITVVVPVNNKPALCYIIVMTRVATGSRLVRQLLHTGHYGVPPKKRYIVEDRSQHFVVFFE